MMSEMEQAREKARGFGEGSPPLLLLAAAAAAMMEGRPHRMVSVQPSDSSWAQAVREDLARTQGGTW